jgi:hypothetical protein
VCEQESFKIQIWVEFKVICKLENSLEYRKGFNPEKWPWAETSPLAQPSLPLLLSRMAQRATGRPNEAQLNWHRWLGSAARASLFQTRTALGVLPLLINPNRIITEPDGRIKIASWSNPLRDKAILPEFLPDLYQT